ncbi:MAG: hypothetical protein R8K20_11240 [Gallionellaceae bacterium]
MSEWISCEDSMVYEPTHWMPLPPPPVATDTAVACPCPAQD